MAVLEKMKLCGLRSFGPDEEDVQSIRFSSPLTLILGENGCGKTTIIETLNFACSGDIPGGSKSGQGFVNDPKLNSTASTKGQVRLCLRDSKGDKYLVIKSVQLINKGATLQFKRLDSTVKLIKPDRTSVDLSSRCSDLDNVICDTLGVSKAILNNVIFCHQENTSWPLDEPKKLKEKFDEIFGATKYNKCAETILKLIKGRKEGNKVLAAKVSEAGVIDKYVSKKRTDLDEKLEKRDKMMETIREKEISLRPIKDRLEEICDLEMNLGKLQSNCTKKETMMKAVVEQQNDILKNITEEFRGTDEELQNEIASFEVNRKKIKDKLIGLEQKKLKAEAHQKQLAREIDKIQIKLGKLQGEKKQYKDTVAERNGLVRKNADGLRIAIPGDLGSDEAIEEALNAFKKSSVDAAASLRTLTLECDREEVQLQEIIDSKRDQLTKVDHSIDSKRQQIKELKTKARTLDSQLRELDYSDEQLKSLQTKIGRIDADLKKWKESFSGEAVAKSIEDNKQKMREDKMRLEELEREYKVLQQNCITEAEIDTQKQDAVKRESEIHKLKNKHFDDFTRIFGDDFPSPELFKQTIEAQKKLNLNRANQLNEKIAVKQKEVTTVQTKTKFQSDRLKSLQSELKANEEQVFKMCKNKPFERMSGDLHAMIEKLQKDKGQYSSAKTMYEKFLEEFQTSKPCCPVCQTGFSNQEAAVNEIVASIKKKIQGIPQKLKDVEEQLKAKQQQYNSLLQLKPVSDKIEELRSTLIPNAQTELTEITGKSAEASIELRDLTNELHLPESIVNTCNSVIGDAALIDQHQREINRAQKKISDLESQIVQVPSNRSRQQTEALIEDLKVDLNNTTQNCEAAQKKLQQHHDRCQEMREERSKHVEKQLQLQKAMQGKPQLQEQLTELTEKEEVLTADIAELQVELGPLKEELKQAERSKETAKGLNKKKLSDAQDEVHKVRKTLDDFDKLQKKVASYVEQNLDGKFEEALNEHSKLKEAGESLEQDKTNVLKSVTEVHKQIATQDGGFRNLTDNQTLRNKRKETQVLTKEIAALRQQIGDHNYRTVLAEKQRLNDEEKAIRNEISMCYGTSNELKLMILKLEKELGTTESKQAYRNYKKIMIEHALSKQVLEDLEHYLKALEFAILKFHQERMAQINRIIRQLWRSIYRGNDIDYIEIKTDEVKNIGNKRSYTYKVVQMKTDVEIDMRGRCSAGQKVLACLIIRMALAETFSRTCGILALDEPTTNLDKANINSLCQALARIVNSRQAEKNFQLIIITHDEEFLAALNHSIDKVSHVWRVSRNEKGNSVITQETVT